ncbi:MAG: hypothetical protein AAF697_01620 [Pseudomonadota bacterium]
MAEGGEAGEIWQTELMGLVQRFAVSMKDKAGSNPWLDQPALEYAMVYLMTELWDQGFESREIEQALTSALQQLPRYSAGGR